GRHPYTDWFGRLRAPDHAAIRRALELTDSLSLADRFFHELSDGERQRVMIARALAQEPQVLLLDEPTAFLDLPRRIETLRLLRNLTRQTGCAVLLSIHDLDLALRIADRLWLLASNGEFQSGIPEELALNGAVAHLFQREGVYFDHASGAFRIHQPEYGPISLHGEQHGVTLAWTWRALERLGYEVHNQGMRLPLHVEITAAHTWQLIPPQGGSEHTTLESLLTALQPYHTLPNDETIRSP
ncbi:MAG: ABC transporter ATP-binding protein, partial [Anaerolineales bacterium]